MNVITFDVRMDNWTLRKVSIPDNGSSCDDQIQAWVDACGWNLHHAEFLGRVFTKAVPVPKIDDPDWDQFWS